MRAGLDDLLAHRGRVERAALVIDVLAVGGDPDPGHLGAELGEHLGRDLVAGAVGAVHHQLDAVERPIARKRALQEHNVAPDRVLDPDRTADVGRPRPEPGQGIPLHHVLDLPLDLVGELEPVAGEHLDAVVLIRVVAGADDHARVGPHRRGDECDPRRRQRAADHHVRAHRHDPRRERRLEQIAGEAGVLADDHPPVPALAAEPCRDRHPQPHRHLRRHRVGVGHPADTIGTEQSTFHAATGLPPNHFGTKTTSLGWTSAATPSGSPSTMTRARRCLPAKSWGWMSTNALTSAAAASA